MSLNVTIEDRGTGTCVVCLEGRLDTSTAPSLEEKVEPLLLPPTKALILNLDKLVYLSSAGLRVIFKIRKTLASDGRTFIITNPQPQIRKVFEIINALPETPIFENFEELDRYLEAMQKNETEKRNRASET